LGKIRGIALSCSLIASSFLAIAFSCVELVAYDSSFYTAHFEKSATSSRTGISAEGLAHIVHETQNLLKGVRGNYNIYVDIDGESTAVFGEQENFHMVEVAGLFRRFASLRSSCAVISISIVIAIIIFLKKKSAVFFIYSIAAALCIIAAIGLFAAVNFNAFFTLFHEMLFSNDKWLFPASSMLIQILDLEFFVKAAIRIIGYISAAYALLLVASLAFFKRSKAS